MTCGGGGAFSTSMTWIAMLAGDFILLVEPPKSDRLKDRGQSSSTVSSFSLFSYFSTLSFPVILLYISFVSVLLSSIYMYNLFALLGRKAPFTQSNHDPWATSRGKKLTYVHEST